MKKLMILPMCAALALVPGVASANVGNLRASGCGLAGGNEYMGIGNGQCVECDTGTFIDARGGTKAHHVYTGGKHNFPITYNECITTSGGDYWDVNKADLECPNNTCSGNGRLVPIPLTAQYQLCVPGHINVQTLGNMVFTKGGTSCIVDVVKAKKQAEKDAAKKVCEASGGSYSGGFFGANGECHCLDSKGLKQTMDKKKCECANPANVFNSATKTCEAPKPSVDPEQLRRACLDSGGDWKKGEFSFSLSDLKSKCVCDAKIGLVPTLDDLKCECKNSAEQYDASKKKCVVPGKGGNGGNGGYNPVPSPQPKPQPTPQPKPTTPSEVDKARSACEGATGAVWNEASKLCACSDTNYEWNGTACVALPGYVQCKTLVSAGTATWNSETKVCMCMQTGYVFNGTACVETAESIAARKAEQAQAAKAAIASVHSKLKKTQSGLDVSAWKDAEGNFNTARLASDSIAGVVLGTTGALVTSTVVKKNQVENGFEDIQCTVGGQTVAQWGDEFSVGSRF